MCLMIIIMKTREKMSLGKLAMANIRTVDSLITERDEESGSRGFKERPKKKDDENSSSFNGESKRIDVKLVLLDKCDGKKAVEDLNSGCKKC